MISETVVELSRWQFAITALFHFLFLPLTLGLSVMLAFMETLYVYNGQAIYKIACQFWGKIFAVNFVLGIATRLAMLFQFGMNGSFFSYYVGDIFALPLAIEVLSAFFLISMLFGPYLFGWERFSRKQHLIIIWFIAFAVNFSALAVLVANGWMQNPVGAAFNYLSMRFELTDFTQLLTNPAAASKAIHTIAASYATAAATVLAISAWLLLGNAKDELARNSLKMAAVLGLAANLVILPGDNTPKQDNPIQILKLAALSGENNAGQLPGIEARIRSGIKAYGILQDLRDDNKDPQLLADFNRLKKDLGYALLMQRWTGHIVDASDKQIALAAKFCLPGLPAVLFWVYRFMIACGIVNLLLFSATILSFLGEKIPQPWLLSLSYYLLPLSWLACICGWFVAEAGKQPWAIAEILPTFLSISSLSVMELIFSLLLYSTAFTLLLAFGLFQIRQTIRAHISTRFAGAIL